MKYSHLCDIGFVFSDENKDVLKSDPRDILKALRLRIEHLENCGEAELRESVGHSDSYPIKEKNYYVVLFDNGTILGNRFGPCIYPNTVEATKKKRRFQASKVVKYNPEVHRGMKCSH